MKQLEGMGMEPNGKLGQAGEAMGRAADALGDGKTGRAVGDQGEALDALRQGAQGLTQQLAQPGGRRRRHARRRQLPQRGSARPAAADDRSRPRHDREGSRRDRHPAGPRDPRRDPASASAIRDGRRSSATISSGCSTSSSRSFAARAGAAYRARAVLLQSSTTPDEGQLAEGVGDVHAVADDEEVGADEADMVGLDAAGRACPAFREGRRRRRAGRRARASDRGRRRGCGPIRGCRR